MRGVGVRVSLPASRGTVGAYDTLREVLFDLKYNGAVDSWTPAKEVIGLGREDREMKVWGHW